MEKEMFNKKNFFVVQQSKAKLVAGSLLYKKIH